jgi:hypothetical protein
MRFILISILCYYSALGFAQEADFFFKSKTTVKWPKTNEGELLSHYFVFENTGEKPLIISDAKVTCPCTKAIFPTYPILPGKTDSIQVQFDTNQKAYYQDRTIDIISNTKKPAQLRLKVYVVPKSEE